MIELNTQIKIFANLHGSEYFAEHIIENLEEKLSNLEYQDVKEGNYQVWEYPTGNIYDV
ncbi:MAG TPA: hypothetical protein VF575_04480 [Candidatus Saccharimonadales bacterium]|jgi:hypothetical protein